MIPVLLVAAVGCASEPMHIPFEPLPEAQPMRLSSGMTTRQRLVVRDHATWADVWTQIVGTHRPIPPLPAVDFAADLVIVASMGTQNSGGYVIGVDDVRPHFTGASIFVTEESPGPGCVVTLALTTPVAVVRVPAFTGDARFFEQAATVSCE